jgi:hypothetical protein
MECNLCTDAGAFCTRSVSDLTKASPCCAAAKGGYLESILGETDDQLDSYCGNDDDEALVDAKQFRTVAADGVDRGKNCKWIAEDPDSRCELEGIQQETAWLTIDTSYIKRLYGKDQIYATQPKYKAKDACPIACGASPEPCADDEEFYLDGSPSMGCPTVASNPKKYCNKKGRSASGKKTKAKNACPAACGKCPCTDSPQWKYKGKQDKGCDWVAKKSKRCKKDKYVDQDGVKSSVACPKACGAC